jgi:glycine/D-amino acid oxidase-like deaminating enzyme
LEPEAAAGLFPSLRADDLAFVLLEPGAGILRAREGVRALVARAVQHGAKLVAGRARPAGTAVLVDGGTQQRLEADLVVWACGAWLPALFPDLLGGVRITQQDVFFFGADAAWATPGVPGWVDYDGGIYGLGDLDGRGFKVAPDAEGPPLDPERAERVPLPAHEQAARAYLAHRFPALAGAPLVFTRTCQYELTADTRFVLAPHPQHGGRVWLLGGGSGHAFKHGPALAELVERWATAAQPPDPQFALGDRIASPGLRTGGRPE